MEQAISCRMSQQMKMNWIDRLQLLVTFPYFWNYLELSLHEYEAIPVRGREILFIGGGPLPMSAVSFVLLRLADAVGELGSLRQLILERPQEDRLPCLIELLADSLRPHDSGCAPLWCVDHLSEAVDQAKRFIARLQLQCSVRVELGDGAELELPEEICGVIVASMAEPKEAILRNILDQWKGRSERYLLVRSVERDNLRALLYNPLDGAMIASLQEEYPAFQLLKGFVPAATSRLINSFELFRVSDGKRGGAPLEDSGGGERRGALSAFSTGQRGNA